MADEDIVDLTAEDIISEEEEREDRKRRNKLLLSLVLTLFVGLLVLILLWLLLFRPPVQIQGDGVVEPIFSIYGLNRPFNAASDKNGNIYVADNNSRRLLVFDKDGAYIRRIGNDKDKEQFGSISGVEVDDAKNRVYATDFSLRRVTAFTTQGKYLFSFPPQPNDPNYGALRFSPFDIAVYRNRLYVTSNDGVYVFEDGKGELMQKWGSKGAEVGFFQFANGIDIDKRTGDIYVGDALNRRVVAMDQKGKIRWVVGLSDVKGESRSFWGLPRGIGVAPGGEIFVADTLNFHLTIIDRNGNLLAIGGTRGVVDGEFNFPESVDVRDDGTVLVADRENNRISVLRATEPNDLPDPDPADRTRYNASLARPGVGDLPAVSVNIIDFQGNGNSSTPDSE